MMRGRESGGRGEDNGGSAPVHAALLHLPGHKTGGTIRRKQGTMSTDDAAFTCTSAMSGSITQSVPHLPYALNGRHERMDVQQRAGGEEAEGMQQV